MNASLKVFLNARKALENCELIPAEINKLLFQGEVDIPVNDSTAGKKMERKLKRLGLKAKFTFEPAERPGDGYDSKVEVRFK